MNFLQMCQRVYTEGGISGVITSVRGQQGEPLRVVQWVQDAYLQLLNDQGLVWNFLKGEVSKQLTIGQQTYTFDDFDLPAGVQWDTRSMRVAANQDLSDETFLIEQRFPMFRDFWLFSSRRTTQSRPLNATVNDKTELMVAPLPDAPYWLVFKWQEMPPPLTENGDIPSVIPERFHMVIVWLALRHYGMFEAAPEVVARADKHYQIMRQQLELDQSYEPIVGAPIC